MIVNLSSIAMSATYYKQERLIIRKTSTSAPVRFWSNLHGSYDSPIAEYAQTSDNVVEIDVTDYVRAYASNLTYLGIRATNSLQVYTLSVTTKGLINPASVIIPPHDYTEFAYIVPPFKLLEPVGSEQGDVIQFEFWSNDGSDYALYQYNGDSLIRQGLITDKSGVQLWENSINRFTIQRNWDENWIARNLQSRMCDRRYAAVKWVSFTGNTREHTFEIVKVKTESAGNYSLLPTDNEYVDIKGRVDSFVIRLDGLCTYDIWYYSDLITSSKVEVSLDGSTYTRVQVTSKSITLPDGEAQDGVLEINVNWKRYDAVTM